MQRPHLSTLCSALLAIVCPHPATAQCPDRWLSAGCPGLDNTATGIVHWDPDGAGPRQPLVVVGGGFTQAGPERVSALAAWDPVARTWSGFGILDGWVTALDVNPAGELVVAGDFGLPSGRAAAAVWNGVSWRILATALDNFGDQGTAHCLKCAPDGSLVIGGYFTAVDGVQARNIARWTGQGWQAMGGGSFAEVQDVEVRANGFVLAVGNFLEYGSSSIWQWNGLQWVSLGCGGATRMALLPQGQIAAAAGNGVYRFDGTHWTRLGDAFAPAAHWSSVYMSGLQALPGGGLIVGGNFAFVGEIPAQGVAYWDGQSWSDLGAPGLTDTRAIYFLQHSNQVYAAGFFSTVNDWWAWRIAVHDASGWRPLARDPDEAPQAFVELPTGEVVAGGAIRLADGEPAGGVVRFDGTRWRPLGQGMDGVVRALARAPDGRVFAGGEFTLADGAPAINIACWDGAHWTHMGFGLDGPVLALAVLPDGQVIAAGRFSASGTTPTRRIARWDGGSWQPLGAGIDGPNDPHVAALQAMPDGAVIAAGRFSFAGGSPASNIARWNGQSWTALGGGLDDRALSLAILPGGELIAAGFFTHAGGAPVDRIARWSGAAWSPIGVDPAARALYSLAVLSAGEIMAGRTALVDNVSYTTVAIWNHGVWSAFPDFNGRAGAMLALRGDDVIIGGPFIQVGNLRTETVAWRTRTPACYPNCDCSTNAPTLNALDFNCFLNHFTAGHPYANCDHSTAPPTLNVLDFNCFLNAFTAGCP
jgi:hypothetical protein